MYVSDSISGMYWCSAGDLAWLYDQMGKPAEGVDSRDTQAFLTANASSVERAYVLGGSFVVPNALRDTIYGMLA